MGIGDVVSKSNVDALQKYISRPVNWPQIVLISNRVEVIKKKPESLSKPFTFFRLRKQEKQDSNAIINDLDPSSDTIQAGDTVIEYFALNQFRVEWTCSSNEPGRLAFVSPDGVPGIAIDCFMNFEFDVADTTDDVAEVQLTMGYTATSLLAVLATPALIIDNWLALNILLPAAVDTRPLDSFRKLMGVLYGIAGVVHLVDLLVGGSQLFTTVIKIPPFEELDLGGQLYSLLWCVIGPLAYSLSITTDSPADAIDESAIQTLNKADIGLLLYGVVELLGAVFSSSFNGASTDVVLSVACVQAIVIATWLYNCEKQGQQR